MDGTGEDRLTTFAAKVREMDDAVRATKGKKAERLTAELSIFIGQETQALVAEGLSVMKIQTALREAVDVVEQTYAPDVKPGDGSGEMLSPPLTETTCFLPLDGSVIDAFADGLFDAREMMARISGMSEDITPIEMSEGLELVASDFGRLEMPDSLTGGEAVSGADGEAFLPEYLSVREGDDCEYEIADPMVFKTAEEVLTLRAFLEPIDKKIFYKRANIKKLIKSGWLADYDTRSVKKEADYIIGALWEEFVLLRNVFNKAAAEKKGIAVFVGYAGADETDGADNEETVD